MRRASVALWAGEDVPPAYVDLVSSLAVVTAEIAEQLSHRHLAEGSRDALTAITLASTHVATEPSLSAEVIRAQVRSAVLDLLMLTGLTYDEARTRVPASVSALAGDSEQGAG